MAELNGRPVSTDELQALALTNYGHFTTMRVEAGRVRGLSLHLERLVRDCRTVFDAELDPARVRELVRRVLPDSGTSTVRVTVFDPELSLATLGVDAQPAILVTVRPLPAAAPSPLRVRAVRYERELPEVKSVGLFGALWHSRAARRAGLDDALFVDRAERICEGATWNIGFVVDGTVVWPEADCLVGVTESLLRQGHRGLAGLGQSVQPVLLPELGAMEAVFATNAVVGVRPVARVEDHHFPEAHPVIDQLRRSYTQLRGDSL